MDGRENYLPLAVPHWAFKKYNNEERFQIRINNTVHTHISDEHFKLPVSRGTEFLCRRCYCLVNLQREMKSTQSNKKKQSLANRGSVIFSLSTCDLEEGRGGLKGRFQTCDPQNRYNPYQKGQRFAPADIIIQHWKVDFCHHSQFSHVLQNMGELTIPRLSKSVFNNWNHAGSFYLISSILIYQFTNSSVVFNMQRNLQGSK